MKILSWNVNGIRAVHPAPRGVQGSREPNVVHIGYHGFDQENKK